MSYLIDTLKEKIGSSEDEDDEIEGFPDLNYVTGQSTGLDKGETPGPLDQRIGYTAGVGGRWSEVQITNPSTFSIEREGIISSLEQLGMNMTLHSDMNAGYTTAYRTSRQGYGFDEVEDYFTQYLQELAAFKKEVKNRGEGDKPLFQVGRINPHLSTTPLPSLSERMAQEVASDPFGFEVGNVTKQEMDRRNRQSRNIYNNPEFMKKFYKLYVTDELGSREYQLFGDFYTTFSKKFDQAWREKQNIMANRVWEDRTGTNGSSQLEEKIQVISTASRRESALGNKWLEILPQKQFDPVKVPKEEVSDEQIQKQAEEFQEKLDIGEEEAREMAESQLSEIMFGEQEQIKSLEDLDNFLSNLSGGTNRLSQMARLPELYYFLSNKQLERTVSTRTGGNYAENLATEEGEKFQKELWSTVKPVLIEALDDLWKSEADDDDLRVSLIPVETKIVSISSQLEIPQNKIPELAFKEYKEELRSEAQELFGRNEDYFDVNEETESGDWEVKWQNFIQRFIESRENELWKESNLFYKIMPAWMSSSEFDGNDGHKGWRAPKFIWKTLVVDKWGDEVDFDLTFESQEGRPQGYFDLLESNMEFRMDVAAASASCYAWGHFTQTKNHFEIDNSDNRYATGNVEDYNEKWTWVEWMNEFGIGINLETMLGSSDNPVKAWQSRHISTTAHAINMTARNMLDERGKLGDREEIHPDLDGCLAKFTIDMEHVATFGIDPWKDIERLVDHEKRLAENYPELGIEEDKPLAKILRQYHLMDPGVDQERGTYHGALERGNELIYKWLYGLVEEGFARNDNEEATILFEVAEHRGETSFMMKVTMDLIELGVSPDELDPTRVDPGSRPESEEEALIARFFGIDRSSFNKEWTKIEEHAFDPLEDLMEAEPPGQDFSSRTMLEEGETRPNELDENRYQ